MHKEESEKRRRRTTRSCRVRKPYIKSDRLRLSVYRSLGHIYAQIIDDRLSKTLVGVGSVDKDIKEIKNKMEAAKEVGKKLASLAKEKEIGNVVVFDRGRYMYHGRIAALADGAREGGLSF